MTDVADLLLLARLSNAAYEDDDVKRAMLVAQEGFEYLSTYANQDHRAFICQQTGRTILTICGTRFSDSNIHELFDDEDVLPVDMGSGRHVMAGFYRGLPELAAWALSIAPDAVFDITGHSLGGARSHLMPLVLPAQAVGQITSFAAPKAANNAYWASARPMQRVVNSRDLWAGWPFLSEWRQPEPLLWLHAGRLDSITEDSWPGGLRASDHSIDSAYIPALEQLVTPKVLA